LDLIPLGRVSDLTLSIIAANLQTVAGLNVAVQPALPCPEETFIATRNQFDASGIIAALAKIAHGAPYKLGVIRHDLCLPILTYVYGESQLGGHAAVVSLYRLGETERPLSFERAAKVSIHEVGHLFGLEHCQDVGCLMRFSRQLEHLDCLPMDFCSACRYEISRGLVHPTRS
jgi:archaemetzincin